MSRPSSVLVSGACALIVSACSGGPLFGGRRVASDCSAPNAVIDAYLDRVADRATREMSDGILERHEGVIVSFRLGADGSATAIRVMRAHSIAASVAAEQAVEDASPYPPPPFEPSACLLAARAVIEIVSFGRCEDFAADRYIDAVSSRIADALARPEFAEAPGSGLVTLRMQIDAEGGATTVAVQAAKSDEAGAKAVVAARRLVPYEKPQHSIRGCVSEDPFFLWIDVPGPETTE